MRRTTALRACAISLVLLAAASSAYTSSNDSDNNVYYEPIDCAAGTVAFEGDSLTYGQDISTETGGRPPINGTVLPRSENPFPELFAADHPGLTVLNRGYPGDRTSDGLKRWKNAPVAQVTFLMYGTNDFGNFARHPDGPRTAAEFSLHLEKLISLKQKRGARVILMAPPPLANPASDKKLEPYRAAVSEIAARDNLTFIDTSIPLKAISNKWTDGLHLSVQSNRALSRYLSSTLCGRL